jgi:ankyrin repeat protein
MTVLVKNIFKTISFLLLFNLPSYAMDDESIYSYINAVIKGDIEKIQTLGSSDIINLDLSDNFSEMLSEQYPAIKFNKPFTLLSIAIINNDKKTVSALLNLGSEINRSANIIAFMIANNKNNYYNLMDFLLKKGIDINTESYLKKEAKTYPLSMAILKKEFKLVKMLLDYGADVGLEDSMDASPMYYAVACGNNYIDLLIEYGGDINTGTIGKPISLAVGRNNIKAVKHLIELGADLNFAGNYNPLLLSITDRNYEMAELLLRSGVTNNGRNEYIQRAIEIKGKKIMALLPF